ncbi:MAG: hypothetical protein ACTHJ0_08825 [Flavipsychrobacter sp.]
MRQTNTLLKVSATTLAAIGIVIIAWILAPKPNSKPNAFRRNVLNLDLKKMSERHFDSVYEKVSGITANNIFFKDYDPSKTIKTDQNLDGPLVSELNIGHIAHLWPVYFSQVTDSNIYILGANVPCIISHSLSTNKNEVFKAPSTFTKGVVVSPATAILRISDDDYSIQIFNKWNYRRNQVNKAPAILDRIPDGGFSTDGNLLYDHKSGLVFYTLFYRNRFYCLDTNLKLLYEARTIDTTNAYTIKVNHGKVPGKEVFTIAAPPVMVNGPSYVANNKLFICSNLKADNEPGEKFNNNAAIDVYRTADGKYLASFYIPNLRNKKVSSFAVSEDLILALYDKNVVTYQLPASVKNL